MPTIYTMTNSLKYGTVRRLEERPRHLRSTVHAHNLHHDKQLEVQDLCGEQRNVLDTNHKVIVFAHSLYHDLQLEVEGGAERSVAYRNLINAYLKFIVHACCLDHDLQLDA